MGSTYYIHLPGIVGNVKKGKYKDWFEPASVTWGRLGGGRSLNQSPEGNARFSLERGAAANALVVSLQTRTVFPTVRIVMTAANGGQGQVLLEVDLKSAFLSDVTIGWDGSVSVELNYGHAKQSVRTGPPRVGVTPARRP